MEENGDSNLPTMANVRNTESEVVVVVEEEDVAVVVVEFDALVLLSSFSPRS